jgi:putative restriction endonuclease
MSTVRDDDVRSSCFASLDVLCAKLGEELPYRSGLDAGFNFRGRKVPFMTPYKGIYRAAAQRGPAALSINTAWDPPYPDEETPEGFLYSYRAGSPEQPDNRALRAAFPTQAPLVYFVGTRPGVYKPLYPVYVAEDDLAARRVLITPGLMIGPLDEQEPAFVEDPIERTYVIRETRTRLHQARFRGRVIPAYGNQCAICRLKQPRLLDAAHIVGDADPAGVASVPNGLSLCSIHHRAFDEDLVGISPDYEVRVAARLREEQDGPMLDLLKQFHRVRIELPTRRVQQPDRALLAIRFDRFEGSA